MVQDVFSRFWRCELRTRASARPQSARGMVAADLGAAGGERPAVELLAIDVDLVKVASTPLAMLIVVVVFVVVLVLLIMFVTQLFSHAVDRRWPANEPLDPTELLWGEMGGYVQGAFKGVDLDVSKSIMSQMEETKVPAGTVIVSQGDPATHFYVLKKGAAEVLQRNAAGVDEVIRQYKEGDSFGEVAILKRTTRTATIRAVSDCVLLQLPAADYVAAAAVSAFHGNDLFAVVDQYLAADRERSLVGVGARAGQAEAPAAPVTAAPVPVAPAPAAPAPAEP